MLFFSRQRWSSAPAVCLVLVVLSGCVAPQSKVAQLQVQNRNLSEQNRAQLVQLENLKSRARNTEDQLRDTEDQLAMLEKRLGLDDQQIAGYEDEREALHREIVDAVNGEPWIAPELRGRLAELSRQYPQLKFDPQTGIAKLDSDILFDSGKAELKPGAEKLLASVASLLGRPETRDLRVMVVGHTDDLRIVRRSDQEDYAGNFDLSSARATTVANRLRGLGVKSNRIGTAGFADHQPVVANSSARERYKNRRVEIFVMAPDVPIVGWTETMPKVY